MGEEVGFSPPWDGVLVCGSSSLVMSHQLSGPVMASKRRWRTKSKKEPHIGVIVVQSMAAYSVTRIYY